jgi:hypothetical protein
MSAERLRSQLAARAPALCREVDSLVAGWVEGIEESLRRYEDTQTAFPKTFTDPVLGPIELFEWEVLLLDSPLLQRLAGIRQLGMGYAVYRAAVHDRL